MHSNDAANSEVRIHNAANSEVSSVMAVQIERWAPRLTELVDCRVPVSHSVEKDNIVDSY